MGWGEQGEWVTLLVMRIGILVVGCAKGPPFNGPPINPEMPRTVHDFLRPVGSASPRGKGRPLRRELKCHHPGR